MHPARFARGLTEIDPRATVMSIDGISAFDLISLQGLMDLDGGSSALPFVALFYGTPSSYLWEDSCGGPTPSCKGTLLFSLGQHSALAAVQAQMADGEALLAFHDGIYTVTMPERVGEVHALLEGALWTNAGDGCIREKHNCGTESVRILADGSCWSEQFLAEDKTAIVWRVQRNCPHINGASRVLGTPLGHPILSKPFGQVDGAAPDLVGQDSIC